MFLYKQNLHLLLQVLQQALGTIYISINTATSTIPVPNEGDYLFFAKNTNINTPGIMGYYAEVEMINDSTEQAELFTVSSEVNESSK